MDGLIKSLGKNLSASHEKTTGETMSEKEIFKAEKIFIKDPVEGGAGNATQPGTKRHTHKIKSSYKSLAAIPTNTLLLDQQAIDEQVEREESPCDRSERGDTLDRSVADTHAEMCSPAELRQQSEELYAVIDEILANSIPEQDSSFTKSLGRETKYASVCSLHPSTGVERKLMNPKKTKPGVIRPMTAIPRLTVEDKEEFHSNPFRQDVVKQTDSRKVESKSLEDVGKDFYMSSKGQARREEKKPERRGPFTVCDLQITEPGDQTSPTVKDASTCFGPTQRRREAFETHI